MANTDRERIRQRARDNGWYVHVDSLTFDRMTHERKPLIEVAVLYDTTNDLITGALQSDIGTHAMVHVDDLADEMEHRRQLEHLFGWLVVT